jgi:O-antigen/teichoic acid export membrane protein
MSRPETILRQSPARTATLLFAAQSAAAIITFPISLLIARALGPTNYGEYQLQLRIALITVTVVSLGLPNALTWGTAHALEPRARARVYELAVGSAIGLGAVPILAAIALLASGHQPGSPTSWLIFGFYPLAYIIVSHIQSSLRGVLLVGAMAQIRIINAALSLIAVVALSLTGTLSAASGALTLVCTTLIAGIFGIAILQRQGAWRGSDKNSTSFPSLLRFGARSAPGLALRDWNVYADQIVVGLYLSTTELGFYALAASFTLAFAQITTPVAATAQPLVQRAQSSEDRLRMVTGLLGVTIPAITFVCLIVAIGAGWFIPTLFGTAFAPAVPLVRLLCIAVVLDATNSCLYAILVGLGLPGATSRITACGFVATILGWIVMLPALGVTGAALTSVAAYGTVTVLMMHRVRRTLLVSRREFAAAIIGHILRAPSFTWHLLKNARRAA